jgi:hypothetical protein
MDRVRLIDLVTQSAREPEAGARAVIALNPPLQARWMLLALAVVAGVVLSYVLPVLTGRAGTAPSPFMAVLLQGATNVAAIILITRIGRALGGVGRYEDTLLLVGWLQALMAALQGVQLLAVLVLPPFALLVMMLSVVAFFWLLTGFICALHGFESKVMVLLGVFATIFAVAMVVAFVLIVLGIPIPGMENA